MWFPWKAKSRSNFTSAFSGACASAGPGTNATSVIRTVIAFIDPSLARVQVERRCRLFSEPSILDPGCKVLLSNFRAGRFPHAVETVDVLKRAFERADAVWLSHDERMETDRHHPS